MDKLKELDKIALQIKNCKICKVGKSGKAVVGEGNEDAKIVFIGEAPGKNEALSGRPFIGRSGKLLRSQIQLIGLREEDVYITSPVKYLPDRGTPTFEDIVHGRTHLLKQLAIIQPQIVVLLGRVAAEGVLNKKVFVMKEHGQIIQKIGNVQYYLTIHPAAAIRFVKFMQPFAADFQSLKAVLLRG